MSSIATIAARWRRRELRREWKLLAAASLLALLNAALAVTASWLMAPLGRTLFPGGEQQHSSVAGLAEEAIRGVFGGMTPGALVAAMALVYLMKNLTEFASRACTDHAAASVERRARSETWASLWRSGRSLRRGAPREEISHALLIDGREAAAWVALGPARLVGDPAALVGFLATLVWVAPALALTLLGVVPFGLWLARRGLGAISRGSDRSARARAFLGGRMGELLKLAPVVRAYGAHDWAARGLESKEREAEAASVSWALRARAAPALAETVGAGAGALLIWLGLRTIGAGALSGAEFLTLSLIHI